MQRDSYIPNKDQRELRELVKYRKSLTEERARELNRLQKMLEGANIKISGTISDINGKTGRNILELILSGETIDSARYDLLLKEKTIARNLKACKEQIIDDLDGVMLDLQRKMMRILLKHVDELNEHIRVLDDDIDNFMSLMRRRPLRASSRFPASAKPAPRPLLPLSAPKWTASRRIATLLPGLDYAPETIPAQRSGNPGRHARETSCFAQLWLPAHILL